MFKIVNVINVISPWPTYVYTYICYYLINSIDRISLLSLLCNDNRILSKLKLMLSITYCLIFYSILYSTTYHNVFCALRNRFV